MIYKGALSPAQMKEGQRNYNLFNLINGLSYICLGEMVIILFAIRMGSPDFCIAALGSFIYLSFFCMPLGKIFLARMGAAKTIAWCWVLRNISALSVASAPLLAHFIHPYAGVAVIMLGAFGFYACRSTGMIGTQPLSGEITTAEDRGRFLSSNYKAFNITAVVMLAIIIVLMKLSRETWVFEIIIVMGSIFGFISAWFIGRVDETEAPRESAKKSIMEEVRRTLRDPMRQKQMLANCVINTAVTLTVPISMLALKRGYGVSDGDALLFALVQFSGAIAASYLAGLLAEETGPRPLVVLFYCSLLALCLLWVIGPDKFEWYYSVWPFLIAGVGFNGISIAMSQYFLITVPAKERVAASLTIFVVSGVSAGIVGTFLGGGLLKWLGTLNMTPIDMFKLYFLIVLAVLLGGVLLVSKLEPKADWAVGDVLGLVFAPRDIMALFNLYAIHVSANPREDSENIEKLLDIKSGLSEKALLSYLDSPKFQLRGRALTALGEIPFGPRAVKAILKELDDGEHTTAHIAAQIAGERGVKEAIPLLREALNSTDYYLQAKSMLALVQLKDAESYPKIKALLRDSENPRTVIYGVASLSAIGDDESFKLLLAKSLDAGLPKKVLHEIIFGVAQLEGFGDGVYKFLKIFNKDREAAALQLSDLCQDSGSARRIAMDLVNGSMSGAQLRELLAEEFSRESAGSKRAIVGEFLRDPASASAPDELLLCLLPLRRGKSVDVAAV